MYLFDFFSFSFNELFSVLKFAVSIFDTSIGVLHHIRTLLDAFPLWLGLPFYYLVAIAILFRVSQFVPTIGGAS